jgi:Putative transposase
MHPGNAAAARISTACSGSSCPAVSTQRLSLTRNGQIRYELKTPYNDGTTHVIFEPLDIMYRMYGMPRAQGCAGAAIARLVALVPRPRVNLTRYHGVFAPHSQYRARVTPAKRGKGKKGIAAQQQPDQTPAERRACCRNAGPRRGLGCSKVSRPAHVMPYLHRGTRQDCLQP